MTEESRKVGRPTKYKEEYAKQAYKLTKLGFIDTELADYFEVDESTINRWKHEYPDFCESIKKGKRIADTEVIKALRKRATGFSYEETKTEVSDQGKKVTTVNRVVVGDVGAQAFWLKNRQPDKWRNNPTPNDDSSEAAPVKIEIEVKDARRYETEP